LKEITWIEQEDLNKNDSYSGKKLYSNQAQFDSIFTNLEFCEKIDGKETCKKIWDLPWSQEISDNDVEVSHTYKKIQSNREFSLSAYKNTKWISFNMKDKWFLRDNKWKKIDFRLRLKKGDGSWYNSKPVTIESLDLSNECTINWLEKTIDWNEVPFIDTYSIYKDCSSKKPYFWWLWKWSWVWINRDDKNLIQCPENFGISILSKDQPCWYKWYSCVSDWIYYSCK
jgi:hypothetical protein